MPCPTFILPRLPTSLIQRSSNGASRLLCTAKSETHAPTAPPFPNAPAQAGHLYVVSTPIGNVADLTYRAAAILHTASIIAAEDTRRTGLLLSAAVGPRPQHQRLLSCHEHNVRSRIPDLLTRLSAGDSVALVSDAGTPCVSDPGAQLVKAAVEAGMPVVPVPGACAALAALVASALPLGEFTFLGFLPRAGVERRKAMEKIAALEGTVVVYEAPHRLLATLDALRGPAFVGRHVCLAREVTKKWEQFMRFSSPAEAYEWFEGNDVEPRGEFTIVLGPLQRPEASRDDLNAYSKAEVDIAALAKALVEEGVPASAVARGIASAADVPKKLVYAFASSCKNSMQKKVEGNGT